MVTAGYVGIHMNTYIYIYINVYIYIYICVCVLGAGLTIVASGPRVFAIQACL